MTNISIISSMGRKKVEGECGICGKFGQLTYEHVPPRAAFNEGKFYRVPSEIAYELKPDDFPKGPVFQGGIGMQSLCGKCNNLTGHWYGAEFVAFAYQAMIILKRSNFKPTLIYPYHIFPLKVIKQVISMFLSINYENPFRITYPELAKFVLDKEEKYLDRKYKIYIYYNHKGTTRYHPFAAVGNFDDRGSIVLLTELSYPPFGFVLTMNSEAYNENWFDITFFTKFGYNEFVDINLKLSILATHLQMPADYRDKNEILKAWGGNFSE